MADPNNNNGPNFIENIRPLPGNTQGLNLSKIRPPIDAALFIDNDVTKTREVKQCGNEMDVRTVGPLIPLPEEISPPVLRWDYPVIIPFLEAVVSTSRGADWLQGMMKKYRGDTYDPSSGITSKTIQEIQDWVSNKRDEGKKHLAVLFDYDRTLTRVEGTYFNLFPEDDPEGFLEYYMGGQKRLEELRRLFDFLARNGVSMFVLTNNQACSNPIFEKVIKALFKRNIEILCGQKFNYNKRATTQSHKQLQQICPPKPANRNSPYNPDFTDDPYISENNSQKGGRRRRNRRKTQGRRRKSKKTRKH